MFRNSFFYALQKRLNSIFTEGKYNLQKLRRLKLSKQFLT